MPEPTPYKIATFEPDSKKAQIKEGDKDLIETLFAKLPNPEKAMFAYQFLFSETERIVIRNLRKDPETQRLAFENTFARIQQIDELMHEEMTGFFRKELLYRYMELKLKNMTDSQIEKAPLTIAVADMAYLSYYNKDTQAGGDATITTLAEEINPDLKQDKGVPFRTGGDEFSFVIPYEKEKAKQIGDNLKKKVGDISLQSEKMAEYEFDLQLRIDLGYATVAEGLKALKQYCSEFGDSESCLPQSRNNQVTQFALDIADRRSKVRKIIQSASMLVNLLMGNTDPNSKYFKKFDQFFPYLQKGAHMSKEQVEKILAESSDPLIWAKKAREHAVSIIDKLEAEKTEQFLMRQTIVKDIAAEDLDLSA